VGSIAHLRPCFSCLQNVEQSRLRLQLGLQLRLFCERCNKTICPNYLVRSKYSII
jgi:hypothetical protein